MIYYEQSFCNSKYFCLYSISLAVLFCILPLDADAQQVYDVNIRNNDVNVTVINGNDLFNNAYDGNIFDSDNMEFGSDSPMDVTSAVQTGSGYGTAEMDFTGTSDFTPPTGSNDPLLPALGGRNPLGFTGYRYFNFGLANWRTITSRTVTYGNTPLETNYSNSSHHYNLTYHNIAVVPGSTMNTSFFNFTTFKNDLISALIGSDNFNFFVRLITILNATPSSTNFTYTVPAIFGFNAGFVINLPFNDILHGTGDWYQFSNVITFFRSLLSVLYYLTVCFIIVRCIFVYN